MQKQKNAIPDPGGIIAESQHTAPEEYDLIVSTLASVVMDDYDRLIQLCDALAGRMKCISDLLP